MNMFFIACELSRLLIMAGRRASFGWAVSVLTVVVTRSACPQKKLFTTNEGAEFASKQEQHYA
ncbi:hypothetical protein [Gynuella sunshinyii]|uniref:Uncharacterized protein n=1 Tax=Gynuella sunshinyii YC6258 TaxID=1445510 RepID=A0A0C5V3K5_9GAMM|nr:hypothetical protein [Gynuella sunshinyii]AJQ94095.1 hypothetical Protein YC6258_02051 [Gynuella sunshinyii YC6258]